jgi:uncharacterized membrane protein
LGERVQRAKQLFITALFSSIIFITNFFVPPPISNLLIVVQAVLLALAVLFIGKGGATYVGLVGGILSALSRPAFGLFTFIFTFLYGLLVDLFFIAFKVDPTQVGVNRNRVMAAMTLSTMLIGFTSYYVIAVYPQIIQLTPADLTPMMAGLIVFVAAGSGISAGYAAAYLWNRYLKNLVL